MGKVSYDPLGSAMAWLIVSLDLPLVWVSWCVPRGVLYRHEEDEDEGAGGGRFQDAVQHAPHREEQR